MSLKNESVPMTLEKKAYLLARGTVGIDPKYIPKTTRSTAGPSAGGTGTVFFSSNGKRVCLTIDENSPFRIKPLNPENDNWVIEENGKTVVTGNIETPLAHCPKQAYINISEGCKFNCKYCSVPLRKGRTKTKEEILKIVENAWNLGPFEAISITSGVPETPEKECERVLEVIPELLKYGVPIGVSIYVFDGCSKILKDANVSEVKYNVEAATEEIFNQVCPGLSYDDLINELRGAVKVFGKGKVYSNLIIGLGETDEEITETVELLAKEGIITELRPVSENPLRINDCYMKRPDEKRLLKLYKQQKQIFENYGLNPDESQTMCSKCGGCDLVPFTDD